MPNSYAKCTRGHRQQLFRPWDDDILPEVSGGYKEQNHYIRAVKSATLRLVGCEYGFLNTPVSKLSGSFVVRTVYRLKFEEPK
jgi:hypothetical protein